MYIYIYIYIYRFYVVIYFVKLCRSCIFSLIFFVYLCMSLSIYMFSSLSIDLDEMGLCKMGRGCANLGPPLVRRMT